MAILYEDYIRLRDERKGSACREYIPAYARPSINKDLDYYDNLLGIDYRERVLHPAKYHYDKRTNKD